MKVTKCDFMVKVTVKLLLLCFGWFLAKDSINDLLMGSVNRATCPLPNPDISLTLAEEKSRLSGELWRSELRASQTWPHMDN